MAEAVGIPAAVMTVWTGNALALRIIMRGGTGMAARAEPARDHASGRQTAGESLYGKKSVNMVF